MNIEERAYQVSLKLCKAHKLRNRAKFPIIKDDTAYMIANKAFNTELDTLTDIDRVNAVSGFNRAFNQIMS